MAEADSGLAPRTVWDVGALLLAVGDALAARFATAAVRGEISGFSRASSGHCYFSLKDAEGGSASIRCVMFRRAATLLDFVPADGQRVELRGRLAVYESRGELQFVVESMQRAGAGSLYEQFLRLKARLESQGLFDAARKRPLPMFPRRIGVVTSLAAAALRDVLTTLQRRSPHVGVVVYPTPVQGVEAPEAIARALLLAAARAEVDTLILCRGGGSLEDLWAFNDERVVRAVVASAIPVVCGVGHETDFSLADLAADLRAPTPTAAAELAAPATQQCRLALQTAADRASRRLQHALALQAQRLDALTFRLARPVELVGRRQEHVEALGRRMTVAARHGVDLRSAALVRHARSLAVAGRGQLEQRRRRELALGDRLRALDPRQVLARGFAWITRDDGEVVQKAAAVTPGEHVAATLADGVLDLVVDRARNGELSRR